MVLKNCYKIRTANIAFLHKNKNKMKLFLKLLKNGLLINVVKTENYHKNTVPYFNLANILLINTWFLLFFVILYF